MCSLIKTLVLKLDPENPDRKIISLGARAIRRGGLVAFPTETVYGLAANFLDEKAIKKLYEVKNRPEGKPFTVHVSDKKIIEKLGCKITVDAGILIDKFWPGPLTVILKGNDGKNTGFRMPANKIALELIRESGVPIVAPSANISYEAPPKSADDVLKQLDGKIDMVLDAGRTTIGIESTVIDMTVKPFKILREGAIRRDDIKKVL